MVPATQPEDRSGGVHNRKYIRSLLVSATQYINGTLPVPAAVTTRKQNGGEGSR